MLDTVNLWVGKRRKPKMVDQSDLGSHCAPIAFVFRCKDASERSSTGSLGLAFGDTMSDNLLGILLGDLLNRRKIRNEAKRYCRLAGSCRVMNTYLST